MKYELNRPGEPLSSSHSAKRVANTKLHFSVRPNPYAALPDEGDRLCRFGGGEVPWCWKLKNPGDLLAAAVVPLLRYPVVADPPRGCIATEYPSRLRCKRWAENVIHSARVQIEPGRATVGCQRIIVPATLFGVSLLKPGAMPRIQETAVNTRGGAL